MTSVAYTEIDENGLVLEDIGDAIDSVGSVQKEEDGFTALGIDVALVKTLHKQGFTQPTPIQAKAVPMLMQGLDLIASAPTGTGKTAAFLLPCLSAIASLPPAAGAPAKGPRVLVLTPTRELAQQVSKAAFELSAGLARVRTVCITGGESYPEQLKKLSRPYEILVATPGRLIDHYEKGRIDFSRVTTFILDEADRMLDMGFSDDVLDIADFLPENRQTVCFTATISKNVRSLASQLLDNPAVIELANNSAQHDCIDHRVIYADDLSHKKQLLLHCLVDETLSQAIIFTATKRDAESLAEDLEADGHAAVALHGDLKQSKRTQMLNKLRRGDAKVLVATDVAARGLDVPAITHVFNFDLPRNAEDYVHRIGRTGRAGASGVALSFVSSQDIESLRRIERFISQKVKVKEIEGMEARFKPGERSTAKRRGGYSDRNFSDRNGGGGRPQSRWGRDGGSRDSGSREGGQAVRRDRFEGGARFDGARNDRFEKAPARFENSRPEGSAGGYRGRPEGTRSYRSDGDAGEGRARPQSAPRDSGFPSRGDSGRGEGRREEGRYASSGRPAFEKRGQEDGGRSSYRARGR
jgi:superfamily II DNA/RNA helicase